MRIRVAVVLGAMLWAGGCAERPWWENEGLAGVGSIAGTDEEFQRTDRLLYSDGIVADIEGSRTYGVFVPKAKAAQAKRLLLEDRALHGGSFMPADDSK